MVIKKMIADANTDIRNYKALERRGELESFDKRQVKMAQMVKDNAEAVLQEQSGLEGDMK